MDATAEIILAEDIILLAEDEPAINDMVRVALNRRGYDNIIQTKDGLEAYATSDMYSGNIRLLITDVRMPNLSGIELALEVRKKHPKTPILFISGYMDLGEQRAMEGIPGPTFFLHKPFTILDFIKVIEKALPAS